VKLALTFVLVLMLLPRAALAAGASDDEVRQLIDAIYGSESRDGKFKEALDKIEVANVLCEGDLCSHRVKAQLLVARGTMQARLGDAAKAEETFAAALAEDKGASLRKDAVTPEVSAAFDKAKGGAALVEQGESCHASYQGSAPGRGWRNGEAYHCYAEGTRAEKDGDTKACETHARASLELEEQAYAHALLARCLEAGDNWIEAAAEWEETARQAQKGRALVLAAQASARGEQLRRRIPVLVIQGPSDQDKVEGFEVRLDGAALPIEILGQDVPVNPGEHTVLSTAKRGDLPLRYKRTVRLEAGATLPVAIELTPYSPEVKCMMEAQTAEQLAKCLSKPSAASNLTVRVGTEVSGYHDTMHVDVATPSIRTSVEHELNGWGVGAVLLVDVVTAASVDILATASPRWREVRWVPALSGHKRWGDVDVGLSAGLSHEPDYLSADVGGKVSVDLRQKTITPTIAYNYSHDVNGKTDTSWSVFAKHINRHALTLDLGIVLTKATFGSLAFTSVFEKGDTSKPYRHIPMFSPFWAERIKPGQSIDAVNLVRLAERPLEQLPDERKRFALTAQVAHRFATSTLRASQRFYADTWSLKATTTDLRYLYDLRKDLRIWPHLRFHAQSATSFYQLAYTALENPDGTMTIPALRTGDRELGPLVAVTGGGGIRYDFGARRSFGISFNGDVVYTRFFRALFVKDRWGYFGALNFEAEFE
jgi:hypothetical protein